MPAPGKAGVVLSGGRSRRMGGAVKALLPLAGRPMIQHVIDRIRPQVDQLMLSVEAPCELFEPFGLEQVADPEPGSRGPLGGLLSTLLHMSPEYEWLVLVPCDAPFVPVDLADKLLERALAIGSQGAVVRYRAELQPTFSIWHRSLLPRLKRAVHDEAMAGFKQFLQSQELAELDWPSQEASPFFNINDPSALHAAGQLINATDRKSKTCSA